jgi:hypothetical protein
MVRAERAQAGDHSIGRAVRSSTRPISAKLFWIFSSKLPKNVILSGAPHRLSRDTVLVARSRMDPDGTCFKDAARSFSTTKPFLSCFQPDSSKLAQVVTI